MCIYIYIYIYICIYIHTHKQKQQKVEKQNKKKERKRNTHTHTHIKRKREYNIIFCLTSISTKLNTQKFCYINKTKINCRLSSMIEAYLRSQKISKTELLVTVLFFKKKNAV